MPCSAETHVDCDPDACFAAKLRTISFGYTYGRKKFHGATNRERLSLAKAEAKANGYDVSQVHKPYSGPAKV